MSNTSAAMQRYINMFESSEARRASDDVILINMIGQIGNAEEVARQVRLYLPEFTGNKTQKQTLKRSIALHFRTRFPGYGLQVDMDYAKCVKLGTTHEVNSKGKIVASAVAKATAKIKAAAKAAKAKAEAAAKAEAEAAAKKGTVKKVTPDPNSVTLKKSDVETLKRQVTDLKLENKRLEMDSAAEIKSLTEQISGLTKLNQRLEKETVANEGVYQRIKTAILKTNNKKLKAMVG